MEFYRTILDLGVPLLAICLSAQLLARVMGASTWRLTQPCIGPQMLRPAPVGKTCFPRGYSAFHWHRHAFSLPPGAHPLATGPEQSCAAFHLGETVLATQFHIEASTTLFQTWMMENAPQITERRDVLLQQVVAMGPEIEANSARVFDVWLENALGVRKVMHTYGV